MDTRWPEFDQIEADILEGIKEEGGMAALDREEAHAVKEPVCMRRSLLLYAITRFRLMLNDAATAETAP